MSDILKQIDRLEELFTDFKNRCLSRENEIKIHMNQIEKIVGKLEDEKERKSLHNVIDFFIRECETNDSLLEVSQEILGLIKGMKTTIEKSYKVDLMDGLKILAVQEEERKRVARELHDSTVQSISSLIYKAEFCSKVIEVDAVRVKLELQIMICSLKDIIKEMRDTIYNLRPTVLEDDNLDFLLKKHINYLQIENCSINFMYKQRGKVRNINEICCITIFRVVQEACKNAIKYSKADVISVEAFYGENEIDIIVQDNGIGFSMEKDLRSYIDDKHFGISIMKERAKLLHGDVIVESEINKGTNVKIHVENVYCDEGENDVSN